MDELNDYRDPLFKGCTRPAMLWGVPLLPLATASGAVIIMSAWTTILLSLLLLPIILVMRHTAKTDDQKFRLLGLKFICRVVHRDKNNNFWKASAYSPILLTKRR